MATEQIELNYRHNFTVNVIDGAFFWLGASFIAGTTVLPVYVSRMTDNKILIGLLATIGSTGWLLPQLFTATWVQRVPRKKVLPVNVGLFTERLPVFLLVLSTLLAPRFPTLALVAFFLCYTWHSFGAGLVAVGWQAMIAKIIPTNRRGRFFGLTNFLGTGTGVVGAMGVAWVLGHYDFPWGYTATFGAAAVFIFLSWIALALTREPAEPVRTESVPLYLYFRGLPAVLRRDHNFGRFLLCQVLMAMGDMSSGFFVVYAVQRWHLSDGQAGSFTAIMLLGQALSNLTLGPLADYRGHKLVLALGALAAQAGAVLAIFAPAPGWFYVVFALLGVRTATALLSGMAIAMEFSTVELRPTYIGLNNTVRGVAYGLAPVVGGWLAGVTSYPVLFAAALVIGTAGVVLFYGLVRDPRLAAREMAAG